MEHAIYLVANQYCVSWKCDLSNIQTAQQWNQGHKKHQGGRIWLSEVNCLCAITELTYDLIRNDDDVARIHTMCTLTMHGDEWSAKFTEWAKWMGFPFQIKPHEVAYRFGGGEKKISLVQEVLPIGIGRFRGYVTSQCIPESSAPLLLSLDIQRALGMILNVAEWTVDFTNLGLYNMPLIKTQDGGLGVRITDFSRRDIMHKGKGRRKLIQTDELTMYASWEGETKDQENSDQDSDEDGAPWCNHGDPISQKVVNQEAKIQEPQKARTPTEGVSGKETGGRPSPGESRDRETQMRGQEIGHLLRNPELWKLKCKEKTKVLRQHREAHLSSSVPVTRSCGR